MFESHITTDPIEEEGKRNLIDAFAGLYGFRRAKLYKENGEESTSDCFFTAHGDDLVQLSNSMNTFLCALCDNYGIEIRRYKIESILVDSKINDYINVIDRPSSASSRDE